MARPQTTRRIRKELGEPVFKPRAVPMSELEIVTLTLDGLEALRLADLEGLYQEEAAARMGVSRATYARILTAARQRVSEALLGGKALAFVGGTVERHAERRWPCPVHGSSKRKGRGCRCRRKRARSSRREKTESGD